MQPKDYDSTLARIAGNIAAGFLGSGVYLENYFHGTPPLSQIAQESVDLAEHIIATCRVRFIAEAPERAEKGTQ